MNKELGATAGAVGQTAAQWQKYSMGQAKIGMAVAGPAAAIGAASTAFVDSEKEKAGILSAMHTAQAIALAFSANPAAAVAHAAAAAMFFGIATGAIKTASPGGGGGGGGAGGSVATPEPAGFTGGGGGGGEGRAINVTFGGGIVLGRPSDVATGWTGSISLITGGVTTTITPEARDSAARILIQLVTETARDTGTNTQAWVDSTGKVRIYCAAAWRLASSGTTQTRLDTPASAIYSAGVTFEASSAHADGYYPEYGLRVLPGVWPTGERGTGRLYNC
jgi:hypothetical protein